MGLLPPLDQNPTASPPSMPLPSSRAKARMNGAALSPSPLHVADDDCASDLSENNQDAPHIEQLVVNHLRFAHAFRKNDAAMILYFLAKDVTLISVDGARHEGQSAVLAYLVGARMAKLSSNLRVKGCPTRSGACQSTFIYEHGIVFKDPLYMEVLDWKPNSATIVRIAHVAVPNAKNGKTRQNVTKMASQRHSFGTKLSDDEDSSEDSEESDGSDLRESENNSGHPPSRMKMRFRRQKSNSVAESSNGKSSRLSGSNSSQSGASDVVVQPLETGTAVVHSSESKTKSMAMIKLAEISCSELSPIRKRKTVNPFVILQCASTGSTWKSPVLRRNPNPTWDHVSLKIPVHNLADVVEISLWDHTLFHSVKVAGAAVVASDLMTDNTEFIATIKLKRVDTNRSLDKSQYVTMQLRFVRPSSRDLATFSSDEVEQNLTQNRTKELDSAVGPLRTSLKGLVMDSFRTGHNVTIPGMLVYVVLIVAIVLMLVITTLPCVHQA